MPPALALKQSDDWGNIYDPEHEQEQLAKVLEPAYTAVLQAVNSLVAQAYSDQVTLRLDDSATRRILQEAATRVVRIDETTRQAIIQMLERGQALGLSTWQLAHGSTADEYPGIDGLFKETWASRAETVARTEVQHAQLRSAVDRYQATGLIDRVQLRDGDDDEPCRSRDGKIVPLEQTPGLAHPNCTLSVIPILREGVG